MPRQAVGHLDGWLPLRQSKQFSHALRHLIVEPPVGIFGPRIEAPVGNAHPALSVAHEDRPRIASPTAIGRPDMKAHALEIRPSPLQNSIHSPLRFRVVNQNMHPFPRGEQAYNLRIDPRNCLKFPRPVFRIVRPRQPRSIVALPLGRHAIAQCSRSSCGRKSSSHGCSVSPSCTHAFTGSI